MIARRTALQALPLPWLASAAWPARAQADAAGDSAPPVSQRIATAWRVAGATAPDTGDRVGLLQVNWAEGRVQVLAEQAVPSRAHGLLPLADGGFMAVANRPGRWLMRCDAQGAIVQRLATDNERPARTFNGHVETSADGSRLYTTETDPTTGAGWISVRDPLTLARIAEFSSHGIDPHQLLRGPADMAGRLMVAVGGIVRDRLGRKLDEPMSPALVQLDGTTGALLGRWTLPDAQLSFRHIAWASHGQPRLGVALQAEHLQPAQRLATPVLAVWEADARGDGGRLVLRGDSAAAVAQSGGYAGDIAAGPGGGFVLSAQKQGRALWWHPSLPADYTTVAQVTEPCGLLTLPDSRGVALSAGRGLALWHTQAAPRMLAWPGALVPDNHWVALARA
ncbi:hypothetical protein IP87_07145 [beta proteobacterium AAP121]|nr:hypothetical protein IP80_17620 [beta proteobacterium AAP65]KPF98886.1 hypothetical protein IP87_07145 [beta proteobacterium AAP121]